MAEFDLESPATLVLKPSVPSSEVGKEEKEKEVPPPPVIIDPEVKKDTQIRLIWELTQGIIAIGITGAVIYSSIKSISSQELTNAFFLIVGFYFSRASSQINQNGNGFKSVK